jgi:hypothetical protein
MATSGTLFGRQTPTFELRPDEWSNASVEAIELYESLGPRLDPWQKHVVATHMVEDARGMWAAPIASLVVQRQNGKGGVTETEEIAGLFLFGDRVVVHTAHRAETSRAAFLRTVELVEGSDDLTRRIKRINQATSEEAIELLDGAVLKFRTRTPSGGRGLTGDRVTFDESQELNADQLEALAPIILARPNPQIVLTGTVPKFDGQFLAVLRRRAQGGERGLAWSEWAHRNGVDVSDLAVLAEVNPAYGIRVSEQTLSMARALLGDEGFERECAGIWPTSAADEWLFLKEDLWTAREDPYSTMASRPAIGVYVPPDRSYSAIAAAGARVGGGQLVEVTSKAGGTIVDHRPGTGWIVQRLQEINANANPSVIIIDDKAVADAAEQAGLVVHRASVGDVVTGCSRLYDGIAGPDEAGRDVYHLGQLALTTAVAGSIKRDVGGSWALDRRLPTVDIGPAAAGALALFGHATPRIHRTEAVTPWVMYA